MNREFRASAPHRPHTGPTPAQNRPLVSDFTCVATRTGVRHGPRTDVDARRIVGGRVSRSAATGVVPDALDQALHARQPAERALIHHGDRGGQSVSIKSTERLAEAGIEPSVGSVGARCDTALAETINGLCKTGGIRRRGPWRGLEAVAFATLEWVDRDNSRRLLGPIGNIPPAGAEERYHAELAARAVAAQDSNKTASGKYGAVQLSRSHPGTPDAIGGRLPHQSPSWVIDPIGLVADRCCDPSSTPRSALT